MKKIIITLVLYLLCSNSYSQEKQNVYIEDKEQKNTGLNYIKSNCRIERFNRTIDTVVISKTVEKSGETFYVYADAYTPQILVEDILASGCISISNVVYNGSEEAIGYFDGAQDIIGMNRGIILSTGKAINSAGENTVSYTSDNLNSPGNAALETIISEGTNDAAVLKFNFIPASNMVKLEFVFASEEYPEFIEMPYADPFAIFISGGPEQYDNVNIALIPETQTNISSITINSNVNSQYYISNWNPATLNTVFDGLTTTLTAKSNVTPGAEYTLKIAIADGADWSYNSAVFLKAGSFTNFVDDMPFSVNTELVDVPNASTGSFTLYRTDVLPTNQPIDILLSFFGSAQMGVDYSMIPNIVTIPPNTDSINVNFETFHYCGPDEKNIIISFQDNCNFNLENTNFDKEFRIIPVGLEVDFSVISLPDCGIGNGVVQALVVNGTEPYTYVWENPEYGTEHIASNLMAGAISVTVSETTGCSATSSFMLDSNYDFILSAEELSPVTCNSGNDGIIKIIFNGEMPYNLFWSNGSDVGELNDISVNELNLENLVAGNYGFTATDANNCMKYFSIEVTQPEAIICPEDLLLEINAEAFTFNGYIQPEGGIYYVDGVVQTEFLPAMYGLGEYNVFYEYIDAQLCSNTCNFNLIVYEDESLPDITTLAANEIGYFHAIASGVVTNNNGFTVINRGFVWSTTEYPTILENTGHISQAGSLGEFQNQLVLLNPSTSYFVRAYAININGISYGQSICFTTEPSPEEIILMQNGVVSTCNAAFYDSGGELSNYSDNSNYVLTIEPSEPNSKICLKFGMLEIENIFDILSIYDGPSIESPLIGQYISTDNLITVRSSHPSGSLTIKFVSDGTLTKEGWQALISCETTIPCQNYSTQIVSSLPEPFSTDSLWINLCLGQELAMSAEVDFVENGLYYTQSEAGLNTKWIVSSQNTYNLYPSQGLSNFSHVFDSTGLFFVFLINTDERGCISSIPEAYKVLVHDTASMLNIMVSDDIICSNEQLSLFAETPVSIYNYELNSRLEVNSCLIDYEENEWALSFNEFEAGRQITSSSDISEICLGIEHSYIGELEIYIRCQNGQQIELLHSPNACSSSFFGVPIDGTGTDCVPGELWNYCFSESATDTITSVCQSQNSVPAGSYAPFQSFEGLIGCPLNGEWYFGIKDNLYSDDGTISYFEINFSEDLLFDTVISNYPTNSISWFGDGIDFNEDGIATAYPSTAGLNQYTLQFDGICGSFDTIINIFVETALNDFSISPSTDIEFLQGDFVVLSVEAVDSAQYQWFRDGIPINNSSSHNLTVYQTGIYSAVIYNSCNSVLSSNSVLVTVLDSIICPENSIVCANSAPFILDQAQPAGGEYTCTTQPDAIINGYFDPEIAFGTQNIHYELGSNSCSYTISVVDYPSSVPDIEICLVTVDENNHNKIMWEKPVTDSIEAFNIYKDNGTNFFYIGNTIYSDDSYFIDEISEPQTQSYRYKIAGFSTCGFESALSDFHQTVLLEITEQTDSWYLSWTPYVGIDDFSVNVLRGTAPDNLEIIASFDNTVTEYTDNDPPSGYVYYQIEVVLSTPCDVSKTISQLYSNIATNDPEYYLTVDIDEYVLTNSIFPNPTTNSFIIKSANTPANVQIIDINGKLVKSINKYSGENIDITDLQGGIYFVKLIAGDKISVGKLVVE
ncbi:MAG: choice-of-anchor L domain-containing protein [Bacteroidales bacterium]|nr:choice-of-anchor L domain-containing protein [Bacteroidales bacterium]